MTLLKKSDSRFSAQYPMYKKEENILQTLQRERKSCKSICYFYGCVVEDNWFVFEWAEYGTLAKLLENPKKVITSGGIVFWMIDLLKALEFLAIKLKNEDGDRLKGICKI